MEVSGGLSFVCSTGSLTLGMSLGVKWSGPHPPVPGSIDLPLQTHMHLQWGEEPPRSLSLPSHPSLPLRLSRLRVIDSERENLTPVEGGRDAAAEY